MPNALRRSPLSSVTKRSKSWWPRLRRLRLADLRAPIWGTIPNQTDSIAAGAITPLDISPFLTQGFAPVTFSAAPLPDGLTIVAATGIISGTPTTEEAPLVTAIASNDYGADETTFTWTITL